jgi:protoporphyrinogen oxidase
MRNDKVTIIGAGPAGLSAAYFLSKKGIKPIIFEAGKNVGGLAGSVKLWNKDYDIGPHIFLESSQSEAVKFWKTIGGTDLINMTLSRGMILKNKLIGFPPQPFDLLRSFGVFQLLLATGYLLKAKITGKKKIKNASTLFQNKYGDYFSNHVFGPFCSKYMGLPDTKISVEFAKGITFFGKDFNKKDVVTEGKNLTNLIYPTQGIKMIWSRVAEKILQDGEIVFEKKLTKIVSKGNRIVRLIFNDGMETEPQFVISTLPIVLFLQMLDHKPAFLLEEAKNLKCRNTVLIYIRLSGSSFKQHYITIFDNSLQAGRITNFNSWKEDQNEKNETVLCVEYWCEQTDSHWTCDDDEMIAKAVDELKNAKIISQCKILNTAVIRLPNSHPILSTAYSVSLAKINNYLSQFENLILIGRQATFSWDGQADNIMTGINLAERMDVMLQNQ